MSSSHEQATQTLGSSRLIKQPFPQAEQQAISVITTQTLRQQGDAASLISFFAGRPERQYQLLADPKIPDAISPLHTVPMQQIDEFHRVARMLDTFTDLSLIQRFSLFVFYVQRALLEADPQAARFAPQKVTQTATDFIHGDLTLLSKARTIVEDPMIAARYANTRELAAMSNRAHQQGIDFIPTELHLALFRIMQQPNQADLEWEEITEQIYAQLGQRYPDIVYVAPSFFYERLRNIRAELVQARELGPEHLHTRQQLRAQQKAQRVKEVYTQLQATNKHTVPNIMEATGFSDFGVRSRLERLGLTPLLRQEEIKHRARLINRIAAAIMKAQSIPWEAVSYDDISQQLADKGIQMDKTQIINFMHDHRKLFPKLPVRRTSSKLSKADLQNIFLLARAGTPHEKIGERYGLTRSGISYILHETPPPLDAAGQPIIVPEFEPKRSYSPRQRERVLALHAEQLATTGKTSYQDIQQAVNAEIGEGEHELPYHTIVNIIVQHRRETSRRSRLTEDSTTPQS